MADNMANNAKIQQELLETMKAILAVMEAQNKAAKDQVGVQQAVRDAAKETQDSIADGFGSMASQAEKLSGGMSPFLDKLKEVKKALPGIAFKAFIDGASKGLRFLKNTFTSLVGVITQVASSIVNMGMAIASIPFRVMSNLIKAANDLAEKFKHIAEAYESFRKDFGDLNNEIGTSMKSALAGAEQMGQFGIGFYNIFTDQAEAIQFFGQAFSDLGPLVDTFKSEIADMGEEFTVLTKSLGISGEALRAVGSLAKATGKPMKSVLSEIGAQADAMQRAFGVSSKLIGKDLGSMVANVRSFGNNSIKTLSAAAMRMRSLGLEVKVLGTLVDKFLNFEDAAKSASMLSQSFGVNLDTIKLMNAAAEGGAGVMDQLRNAMFAAGRDASKMSTAELRLLAQQTGLSEEEARLAFAMENRGKSMEEIQKIAKKTDPQEKMADTMERLANNIERVIRVFKFESFFKAFSEGFSKGVGYGKPFVAMLQNLYKSLNIVHWAGFAVGKMFSTVFPGVKKMADSLGDLFDPKRYKEFASKIENAFKELFDDLSAPDVDPVKIMRKFWDSLMESFAPTSMFEGEAADQFKEGFMSFMGAMRDIIIGTLPIAVQYFKDGISILAGLLSGEMPDAFKNAAGEAEGFGSEFWTGIIEPILKALDEQWPTIKAALIELGYVIFSLLVDALLGIGVFLLTNPLWVWQIVKAFSVILLGSAFLNAISAVFASLASLVGPMFGSAFDGIFGPFFDKVTEKIGKSMDLISTGGKKLGKVLTSVGTGIGGFFKGLANGIGGVLKALGAGIGGFLKGVSAGLTALASPQALIGLGALTLAFIGFAAAMNIMAPALEPLGKMFKSIFEGIASIVVPIIETLIGGYLRLAEVIGGTIIGVLQVFASIVETVYNAFVQIATVIGTTILGVFDSVSKTLGFIVENADKAPQILQMASSITAVGLALAALGGGAAVGAVAGFYGAIAEGATSLIGGSTPMQKLEELLKLGPQLGTFGSNIQPLTVALASLMTSANSVMQLSSAIYELSTTLSETTPQIVADVSAISAAANNIPELNVPVMIEPTTGGNLDIKNKKLEFTSEALHIVLNLNVTMESDKLADVILETKKVMPREKV